MGLMPERTCTPKKMARVPLAFGRIHIGKPSVDVEVEAMGDSEAVETKGIDGQQAPTANHHLRAPISSDRLQLAQGGDDILENAIWQPLHGTPWLFNENLLQVRNASVP